MLVALLVLAGLLAFANGSNDNSKGVATLVGFGAARPFQALLYATLATALGGGVSFYLAGGLLQGFSGGWLFSSAAALGPSFYVAVLIGACAWVLLASWTGMPVSTTHAIIGSLCGAGVVAFGARTMQWSALGVRFAVPLALSPVLSLVIVYAIAWPVLFAVRRMTGKCVCAVEMQPELAMACVGGGGTVAMPGTAIVVDTEAACAEMAPTAALTASSSATAIHWASAGLVSFARGWNDTPKIAALSLLALSGMAHGTAIGFVLVTVAMAAGGLIGGRKVLDTLSNKVTPLPLAESLTASMVTAALVGLASWISLPVSTTHVATGSILGAGLMNDPSKVKWSKVGEIALSWVITLPVAALIAASAQLVLR